MKQIFSRSSKNPIIKPNKNNSWESFKVYNPGVIYHNDMYHMFYRASGKEKISSLGYAVSDDGEKFKRSKEPILKPELDIEVRGLEDSRISKVDNRFFMTYTAYDGKSAKLCLAISKDLKIWERQGEIFPDWDSDRAGAFVLPWDIAQDNIDAKYHWLKAGAIFPERLNGKYRMLFGDRNIWSAESENGLDWTPEHQPFLKPRHGFFDSVHVEMGPPPMRTEKGWLVLYHGIDEAIAYRLGWLLLDLHDPNKIIKRGDDPIFEGAKKDTKKAKPDIGDDSFDDPNIIFCNGTTLIDKELRIYYGGGDVNIGTATANLQDILDLT